MNQSLKLLFKSPQTVAKFSFFPQTSRSKFQDLKGWNFRAMKKLLSPNFDEGRINCVKEENKWLKQASLKEKARILLFVCSNFSLKEFKMHFCLFLVGSDVQITS
jgi:hypothetical protein